jgi:hypothetical protein
LPEEAKADYLKYAFNLTDKYPRQLKFFSKRINNFQVSGLNVLIVPNLIYNTTDSDAEAVYYLNPEKTKGYIVIPKKLKSNHISFRELVEHEILHSLQYFLKKQKVLNLPESTITEDLDMVEEPFSWSDMESFVNEFEAYFLHLEAGSKIFKTKKEIFEKGSLYDLSFLLNNNITKLYEGDEIPQTTKIILLNLTKNLYQLVPKITDENKFEIMFRVRGCKNFREILTLFEEINQVKINTF